MFNIVINKENFEKCKGDINHIDNIFINIYDFKDINLVNKDIPTLYIGYYDLLDLAIEFDILNKKINDLEYWTYSKDEKLSDYYDILYFFIENVPYFHMKNINYECFNFLLYDDITSISELLEYIKKMDIIRCYINKRGVFLLKSDKKTIFSVDFKYLGYIDRESTINFMKSLIKTFDDKIIIKDFDNLILDRYKLTFSKYTDFLERIIVKNGWQGIK